MTDHNMQFSSALAASLAHQGWLDEMLDGLDGQRAYIFGLLLYEEVVAMAEAKQLSPPGIEAVVEALWGRLPNKRSDPFLDSATEGWLEAGSTPAPGSATLTRMPERFNWVSIQLASSATLEALEMWNEMTSIVPDEHQPAQFAAERDAVEALQRGDFDLATLRARAREVGRRLVSRGV